MSKFYQSTVILFCIVLLSFSANAQSKLNLALTHIQSNAAKYNLTSADISNHRVINEYKSDHNGVTHIYLQQQVNGLDIDGAYLNINLDKNNRVVNMGTAFVANAKNQITGIPVFTASSAVSSVVSDLNLSMKEGLQLLSSKKKGLEDVEFEFSRAGVAADPIIVRKIYFEKDGKLKLGWEVSLYTLNRNNWWINIVDASTGKVEKRTDHVLRCSFGPHAEVDAEGAITNIEDFNFHSVLEHNKKSRKSSFAFMPQNLSIPSAAVPATFAAGSYKVYKLPLESPDHGERSMVVGAENVIPSPLGWHDNGTTKYTITRGNNVHAYYDPDPADAVTNFHRPAQGTNDLVFDFPLDLTKEPTTYIDAAVTNLFYWNNIIHDVFFFYGFNEVAGNPQNMNFSGMGIGNDAVNAEAQDGSGKNNANMSTPADGSSPRMQMYVWNFPGITDLLTVLDGPAKGVIKGVEALFSEKLTQTGVTGKLVYADPNNGCAPVGAPPLPVAVPGLPLPVRPIPATFVPYIFDNVADMVGNIALVDRGTCGFQEKAHNAQISGASAVIVVNDLDTPPTVMSGSDADAALITIPAIMISKADGARLKEALQAGEVNVKLAGVPGQDVMIDGDFDAGVIAHEYGHTISIRLAGGPGTSGCLSGQEQQGEGWSDFFGLFITATPEDSREKPRGIGNYVTRRGLNGRGIRPAPYSTDMTINTYTHSMVANPEITVPHGVGFIWATMLYEMYWNLIDKHGYDDNKYTGKGGNNITLQLVLDGLKLMNCSPTFVDARNAILLADTLNYNGANSDEIWRAFAKRGLGFSASSGTSGSRTDNTDAFDLPPGVVTSVRNRVSDLTVKLYPNPTDGQVNLMLGGTNRTKVTIDVYNLLGQKVWSDEGVDQFNQAIPLNLSNLKQGVYQVIVTQEGKNKFNDKLIIN